MLLDHVDELILGLQRVHSLLYIAIVTCSSELLQNEGIIQNTTC